LLAKIANDDAGILIPRIVCAFFASKLAPTTMCVFFEKNETGFRGQ